MAYKHARFLIYYRDGTVKAEDRAIGSFWDDALKMEYICPECSARFPYYPEAELDLCLKCNDIKPLIRQSKIIAMGIQFDPFSIIDPEINSPLVDSNGTVVRMVTKPYILKGSNTYNYAFFQDKTGEMQISQSGQKRVTHGLRIGMVLDPQGHCFCMTGYLASGTPTTYSYYTTIYSLGLKEALDKLHHIKLSECGQPLLKIKEYKTHLNTNLGERLEVFA